MQSEQQACAGDDVPQQADAAELRHAKIGNGTRTPRAFTQLRVVTRLVGEPRQGQTADQTKNSVLGVDSSAQMFVARRERILESTLGGPLQKSPAPYQARLHSLRRRNTRHCKPASIGGLSESLWLLTKQACRY